MKRLGIFTLLLLPTLAFCQATTPAVSSTQVSETTTAKGIVKTVEVKYTGQPDAKMTLTRSPVDSLKVRLNVSADVFRNGGSLTQYDFASVVDDGSDYSMEYRRGILLVYTTDPKGYDHVVFTARFGPVVTTNG